MNIKGVHMKKVINYKISTAVLLLAGLFATGGCTKSLFKQSVPTDSTSMVRPEAKALVDVNAEYLYVPSSLYSTRTTDSTFPMYMGEAKIVRLSFDENNLQVVEVDPESQFSGNPVNNKPVLSIPVSHVDYRCSLDAYGNCTNHEELDTSKPWSNRSYIQLQPDKLAAQEVNFLPVDISNLFYPCYQVVSSNFVNYKLEKDALNVDIEKIYKTDISNKKCEGNLKSLSDITFSVVYHYSMVKLNTLISSTYKPFAYSRKEESTFGFFDTDTLKLGVDNNNLQSGEKLFLNRWNPAKSAITYYLTSNFNKPENAKIKTATIAAIQNINNTLVKSGANFQIVLKDAPDDFNPGDLRNNAIIMVEEPVNYGILGYGPTAANPRTGEIVKGHVAMYAGVMKETIQRAYDDLLLEKKPGVQSALAKTQQIIDAATGSISVGNSTSGSMTLGTSIIKDFNTMATYAAGMGSAVAAPIRSLNTSSNSPLRSIKSSSLSARIADVQARAERLAVHKVSLREIQALEDNDLARQQIMSVHCYYDADAGAIESSIEGDIDQILKSVNYKAWADLSDDERTKVIDAIMPFLWIPTLTHEMGHNLGLRHNFAGSEDKDNFYTADELKGMGISRQFSYSSVMDYGYHSNKELQVMGKYDIAALRFGYAEKVEIVDATTKAVSLTTLDKFRADPTLTLKPYKFCTDEHVDVNPNWKRFDEGTSLVEIAGHWLKYYEDSYRYRSFRNGLQDFSLIDDLKAAGRIQGLLFNLRMMFERYDDIKNTFNLADNAPEWAQFDFLKDLKTATIAAANFYVSILQTPDTLCAAAQASDPTKIIAVVPLRQISTNAISCLDAANVQIPAQFKIVGQAGRAFQSKKDPSSTNNYMDQIDVRGQWINKLLAVKMLTMRQTGVEPYDTYTDNFLDMADVKDKVQKALSDILLDEVVAPVAIFTVSGQTITAPMQVKMYNTARSLNTHIILNPLSPAARAAFGLPNDNIEFQAQVAKYLKNYLPSQQQKDDPASLLNAITVRSSLSSLDNPSDFVITKIGLTPLAVNKQSSIALAMVNNAGTVEVLSRIDGDKLQAIANDVAGGKVAPADASADEKAAYAMSAGTLANFLGGVYDDKPFYSMTLRSLAQ